MRAEVSCEIDGERADRLSCKIDEERADGLPYKIVGKIAAGMTRKELVMNELMGSTANEEFERRIAASWCGSRVAGWRIAVVKTSASLVDIASLASKASLVSLDTKWNVMVPRMKMTTTHRKRENQCDACHCCVGFDGFFGADGFDGVDGMDGFDGWGDSFEMERIEKRDVGVCSGGTENCCNLNSLKRKDCCFAKQGRMQSSSTTQYQPFASRKWYA